ncbi:hypothetical protein BJV74DRAFT_798294 [Russula compacta]|nr:hypothetical protein BJV74DRAFT_798294 [Russula compacta]
MAQRLAQRQATATARLPLLRFGFGIRFSPEHCLSPRLDEVLEADDAACFTVACSAPGVLEVPSGRVDDGPRDFGSTRTLGKFGGCSSAPIWQSHWHPSALGYRSVYKVASWPAIPILTMATDGGERERKDGGDGGAHTEAMVPPAPATNPVQLWLAGFPAYQMDLARSGRVGASAVDHSKRNDDCRQWRRHRDSQASSASSASLASRLLPQAPQPPPPPPLPVLLSLSARRACSIHLRVVRPLSAGEKLGMRDAVTVLVRLGTRVVRAEAGWLGLGGEMRSLGYVGF